MIPDIPALKKKIWTLEEAIAKRQEAKASGRRVVWTNGCFDLLHIGHISYLFRAAELGHELWLGLNSDDSVRSLKGPHRPIFDVHTRATKLAALSCIDGVIIYEDSTPLRLIRALLPDLLVKGGDYSVQDIVGHDEVIANGGVVTTIPFVEGQSSTTYIDKIKQQ